MISVANMSTLARLEQEILLTKYSKIMFASVNHELRTPINVIISTLTLLSPLVLSEKAKSLFKIMQQSATLILHLINDTLDLVQMQAKNFNLFYDDVNLKGFLDEVS